MANTLVQFRIDEKQRKQAEGICAQLGLDLPSYLRMSVTRLIREKKVPFELCVAEDDKYAAALVDAISKLEASAEANGLSEGSMEEIDAEMRAKRKQTNSLFGEAVSELQASSEANGLSEMSMEEIDAEIAAARAEMRAKRRH